MIHLDSPITLQKLWRKEKLLMGLSHAVYSILSWSIRRYNYVKEQNM